MSLGPAQHIVLVSWPAIGHARPMLDFASSILRQLPNLTVTFVCSSFQINVLKKLSIIDADHPRLRFLALGRAHDEVAAAFTKKHDEGAVETVDPAVVLTMQAAAIISNDFNAIYEKLHLNQPVLDEDGSLLLESCASGPPSVVIINWMLKSIGQHVRKVSPKVRMMAFFDNAAVFVTRMLGPVSIGGYGGVQELWNDYLHSHPGTDANDLNLREKMFGRRERGSFEIPGTTIEKMHDYQMGPQAKDYLMKVPITPSLVEIQALVDCSDAILVNTHESIEAPVLAYLRTVVKKEIYAIGTILFDDLLAVGKMVQRGFAKNPNYPTSDVTRFLDASPANSVLYISFGTLFRPTPSQLVEMLAVLVDQAEAEDVRFVWTLGGGKSLVDSASRELRDQVARLTARLERSGRGLLINWVDQHAVLQHPSVGWFLSHGGWNSCQEALLAGKPLLVFPFFGDQLFDAYLLKSLGVAYHIESSRFEAPEKFLASYRHAITLCQPGSSEGAALKLNSTALRQRIMLERQQTRMLATAENGGEEQVAPDSPVLKQLDVLFNAARPIEISVSR